MALPNLVDPASPANADSPGQGALQIRNLKQYIIDVFGVPNAANVTAAPMSVTAAGLITVSQSPLTVPTLLQGAASQWLRIGSPYSGLSFEVNNATMLAVTATGVLQQSRYYEWVSGVTGVLGTQGAQPLILRSNTQDQWQVNPSGMLTPVPSTVDLGSIAGPNPRNLYVASNLLVGGQIQAGAAPRIITTTTGMLDGRELTFPSEVRGDVLFRGASTWQRLAAGTVGQVFTTQGNAVDPIWQTGSPGVAIGDNPAWTGQHSWSIGTNMFMSSPSVRFGLGTSSPTLMLHVAGNAYTASNLYMVGQLVAGQAARTLTTATGLLDAAQLSIASEARGDILFRGASAWSRLAGSTSGFLLQTQSTTADPLWVAQPAAGITVLDRVTADTTVTNTAAETTIYTRSISGGTVGTNGQLRLSLQIRLTTVLGATNTLTIRFKYGATTLITYVLSTDNADGGGASARFASDGVSVVARLSGDGATNAQVGQLVWVADQTGGGFATLTSNNDFRSHQGAQQGTSAIDSTVAQNLVVTAQFGLASATNTLVMQEALLEQV